MARKKSEASSFIESDWEVDSSLDDQIANLLATISSGGVKRESGWRRVERYREDKQLQERLREFYE